MPHRVRWRLFMVAVSWIFYGAADWRFVPLLAGSTIVNHFFAWRIYHAAGKARRAWTIGAVTTNLAVLAWFKYIGFLSLSSQSLLHDVGIHAHVPLPEVLLPIGISFFTFQALSYVIDTSRGKIQPVSLLEFAVYLSFFPHLVAGPIVRATEFLPQIKERIRPRHVDVGKAFWLISLGLFKKVVIASYLATYAADPVFGFPRQHAGVEALFGVYAYAIQIYADFSGYTDIAIGLALLLGIKFPQNFNSPYAAASLQDFWRRWHMTLSRWLRDYLYIPLGGSRRGRVRTYVNVMITMLLGGLWHGAAWTFVAWGALHGAGLVVERARHEWRSAPVGAEPDHRRSQSSAVGADAAPTPEEFLVTASVAASARGRSPAVASARATTPRPSPAASPGAAPRAPVPPPVPSPAPSPLPMPVPSSAPVPPPMPSPAPSPAASPGAAPRAPVPPAVPSSAPSPGAAPRAPVPPPVPSSAPVPGMVPRAPVPPPVPSSAPVPPPMPSSPSSAPVPRRRRRRRRQTKVPLSAGRRLRPLPATRSLRPAWRLRRRQLRPMALFRIPPLPMVRRRTPDPPTLRPGTREPSARPVALPPLVSRPILPQSVLSHPHPHSRVLLPRVLPPGIPPPPPHPRPRAARQSSHPLGSPADRHRARASAAPRAPRRRHLPVRALRPQPPVRPPAAPAPGCRCCHPHVVPGHRPPRRPPTLCPTSPCPRPLRPPRPRPLRPPRPRPLRRPRSVASPAFASRCPCLVVEPAPRHRATRPPKPADLTLPRLPSTPPLLTTPRLASGKPPRLKAPRLPPPTPPRLTTPRLASGKPPRLKAPRLPPPTPPRLTTPRLASGKPPRLKASRLPPPKPAPVKAPRLPPPKPARLRPADPASGCRC